MKNLTVVNVREENRKYTADGIFTLAKAQIENSLELGWDVKDLIVLSNREFEYLGVKARVVDLNDFCLTGSKVFAVKHLFDSGEIDVIWAHDLDAWADIKFECPEFNDVGITEYSRPKVNGGSVIWKSSAIDIINEVVNTLFKNSAKREEPILNHVLRKYPSRVTILNHSYNVGCSGFVPRYVGSVKPVRVWHFHPTNSIAWETHVLDRSGICGRISNRLEKLIRKHYPNLATELSEKGKIRRIEKINERMKKGGMK